MDVISYRRAYDPASVARMLGTSVYEGGEQLGSNEDWDSQLLHRLLVEPSPDADALQGAEQHSLVKLDPQRPRSW